MPCSQKFKLKANQEHIFSSLEECIAIDLFTNVSQI